MQRWLEFLKDGLIGILIHVAFYLLLGIAAVIGYLLYFGTPFSLYLIGVMLVFILLARLARFSESRLSEDTANNPTHRLSIATFLHACASVTRVMCLSAIPILIYQVVTFSLREDYEETIWLAEKTMLDLNLWAQVIGLDVYLTYFLIASLALGVIATYRGLSSKGAAIAVKSAVFAKGLLFFVDFLFSLTSP